MDAAGVSSLGSNGSSLQGWDYMYIHTIMEPGKQARRKTLVREARAIVERCIATSLRRAAREAARHMDAHLAETGMGFPQFSLMVIIAAAEDDTIGALAERTGLDPSTLSRTLRTLERAGLVEIAVVEADLRRRAVWLTETGARRLEAATAAWKQADRALSAIIERQAATRLARHAEALGRRQA